MMWNSQTKGGILDIVVTRTDDPPRSLYVEEVGLSDHSLVAWSLAMRRSTTPTYVTSERREWKDFTCHSGLRITCQVSALSCSTRCSASDLSNTDLDAECHGCSVQRRHHNDPWRPRPCDKDHMHGAPVRPVVRQWLPLLQTCCQEVRTAIQARSAHGARNIIDAFTQNGVDRRTPCLS